jgi:hypothetical protein
LMMVMVSLEYIEESCSGRKIHGLNLKSKKNLDWNPVMVLSLFPYPAVYLNEIKSGEWALIFTN